MDYTSLRALQILQTQIWISHMASALGQGPTWIIPGLYIESCAPNMNPITSCSQAIEWLQKKIIWDTGGVGGKGSRGRSGERTMICVVIKRRRSIVIEQAGLGAKANAGCLPLCWGMLSIDLLLSLQKMTLTDKMNIGRGRRASDGSGD